MIKGIKLSICKYLYQLLGLKIGLYAWEQTAHVLPILIFILPNYPQILLQLFLIFQYPIPLPINKA